MTPFDGTMHPYAYCKGVEACRILDDEDVVQSIQRAAYLILVWYVDETTHGDAQRTALLDTFFVVVTTLPRRRRRPVAPTPDEQRARTCLCSEELVAYVRGRGRSTGTSVNEFDLIRSFLRTTDKGLALLRSAGVTPGAFELDHYVPECLGGPSVVENAHIMPRNGDNQHFGDAWDRRKREYCGELQHLAIRRIMTGLTDSPVPGDPGT